MPINIIAVVSNAKMGQSWGWFNQLHDEAHLPDVTGADCTVLVP